MTPGAIPPIQEAAAATFGKLVAQGVVESKDAVESLYEAAIKAGYQGDQAGLRTRLWWRVRDNADEWHNRRIRADVLIRRDLAPMLDAEPRIPAMEIWREAQRQNARHGEPFLSTELFSLVDDEMGVRLARDKARRRHYGRR